ncbi:hypothetical protein EYB39_09185 [Pantoea agglomerans]|nr:hypothetical protein EYB39_09185 [Pantoea agglomerans]
MSAGSRFVRCVSCHTVTTT